MLARFLHALDVLFPVCPADKARVERTRAMIAASQRWLP